MSLNLNTRKVEDVVIVDMAGRLDAGEGVASLRNIIRRFREDGNLRFVLNLGDVSYIDSSGLGELTAMYASLKKDEGKVVLLNLTKTAKDLLQMTKLLVVFDTFDDETKAVRAAAEASRAAG